MRASAAARRDSFATPPPHPILPTLPPLPNVGFVSLRRASVPAGLLQALSIITARTVEPAPGRLAGFGLLRRHSPWPTAAHVAEITYFVAPTRTHRGTGSMLLAELERQAPAHGVRTVLASISSLNEPSLPFHRKHGSSKSAASAASASSTTPAGCAMHTNPRTQMSFIR